jgi:GPH family glycoside/pentoside/hexuronide:cation symporter
MSVILGTVIMLSGLATFFLIREPHREGEEKQENIFSTLLSAFSNKSFLTAGGGWFLHGIAVTGIQAALLYYFIVFYGTRDNFLALAALLGTNLIMIFVMTFTWEKISSFMEKKTAYILGMSIMGLSVLTFFFFGHILPQWFVFIIMGVSGIGLSTHYIMPHAMLPEVVEWDAAETGLRREGIYSSLWTFTSKISIAISNLLVGIVLQISGYNAESTVFDAQAQFGVRFIMGPLPLIFFILGVVALWKYPITKETYQELMAKQKK